MIDRKQGAWAPLRTEGGRNNQRAHMKVPHEYLDHERQ
jgi:hypothetical protein